MRVIHYSLRNGRTYVMTVPASDYAAVTRCLALTGFTVRHVR